MQKAAELVSAMSDAELRAVYTSLARDYPAGFAGRHLPARIDTLLDEDVLAQRPFLELAVLVAHAFRDPPPLDAPPASGTEMTRAFDALGVLAIGPIDPAGLAHAAQEQIKKLT